MSPGKSISYPKPGSRKLVTGMLISYNVMTVFWLTEKMFKIYFWPKLKNSKKMIISLNLYWYK